MKDSLHAAFDRMRADEALVNATAAFVARETRKRKHRAVAVRTAVAACLACVCLGAYRLYSVPTAWIGIDINPSLELAVNRFDRVVAVESFNADGDAVKQQLQLRHSDYNDAVRQVLESQRIAELLADEELLSITVIADEGQQRGRMLQDMADCTAQRENTLCGSARPQEAQNAYALGLSCGKYKAYLELQALDPSVRTEDVQHMTMRQIYDEIARLGGGSLPQGDHSGNGYGNGGGNGQQNRYGK